ncbi:putative non-specific serine/threonine protein kinase [Helianthus annuus]|nr:putative non-specific serine/threonine protein kinase [Helianthus annuus]KAJ0529330.1 putative non-specific serine/threonine protein kinase [Helianthus annuus]KAJ0696215.1 putative non-specific serine/threonine protein kinase [Helianthus annuus]
MMLVLGSNRGEPRSSGAVRSGAPQKALPIEAPKLSLVDLKQMTGNFGSRVLIGDGSYCQVYYGKLSDGQEAIIKMLDTSSSSPEPDTDFTNQVRVSVSYLLAMIKVST